MAVINNISSSRSSINTLGTSSSSLSPFISAYSSHSSLSSLSTTATASSSDYTTHLRNAVEAKLYYIRDTVHSVEFDERVDVELQLYQQQAAEAPVGFRIFVKRVREFLNEKKNAIMKERREGKEKARIKNKKGKFVGGIKLQRQRLVEDLWASYREV